MLPALEHLYDEIWVYGLPQIFDPLREIPGMAALADEGALHRLPQAHRAGARPASMPEHQVPREDFILVTPGGGGDGAELIDWVIGAYESDAHLPHRAVHAPYIPKLIANSLI